MLLTRNSQPATRNHLRYMTCAMVLVVSTAAVYALYPRFVSQIYYLKARKFQKAGYLGLAVNNYHKASDYQPRDANIWQKLAEARLNMGEKKSASRGACLYPQSQRFISAGSAIQPFGCRNRLRACQDGKPS